MVLVNVIKTYRDIVAICDSELLGKRFEEGKFQLDVKESFYRGKETSLKEAIEIIKNMSVDDATFNIVGEESVKAAVNAGIISEEDIGKIQGIPFALGLI